MKRSKVAKPLRMNKHGCMPRGDRCVWHHKPLVNPRGCELGHPQGVAKPVAAKKLTLYQILPFVPSLKPRGHRYIQRDGQPSQGWKRWWPPEHQRKRLWQVGLEIWRPDVHPDFTVWLEGPVLVATDKHHTAYHAWLLARLPGNPPYHRCTVLPVT